MDTHLMADNAIALQINPPANPMTTIGGMIDAARKMQDYRRSSETYGADVARSKAESETAQAGARVATANVNPLIAEQASRTDIARTQAAAAALGLSTTQFQRVQDDENAILQHPAVVKAATSTDPEEIGKLGPEIENAFRQHAAFARGSGIPPEIVDKAMAPYLEMAKTNPGQVRNFLAQRIAAGQNAGGQAQQGLVPASGQQQPGGTDISGNPTAVVKDQFGRVQQATLPVAAPAGQPAPAMRVPTGELPLTPDHPLVKLRDSAQSAAAQAPSQHFNNQQILGLSSDAFTGTGSGKLAAFMNGVGIPFDSTKGDATAQLQHFMALQIEQNASAQGANTDAARKMAAEAVLPGSSPEKAIKAITKVNDAYVTGNELFNAGLQSAVRNSPNGLYAGRQFQNAWSQNMDPRIFQIENAAKAGDKAEITRIKAQLGPAGVAELTRKAHALRELIGSQNGS